MKTVFFGTPEIAVPALIALAETTDLVGVVCQPDRPAGRKLQPKACAVKLAALERGLTVHQPVQVRNGNLDAWLRERDAELGVVLAYGRILPARVLEAPRFGCVNLHASLLPKYRGAAPIQWAIANGETETGVCLMRMDEGLDTGPVYRSRTLPIGADQNAGELAAAIAELCARMVREDLVLASDGTVPVPQDHAQATHAPPLRPEHALIDWSADAKHVHDQVRAFAPNPGAHTFLGTKRLKVLRSMRLTEDASAPPGSVVACTGSRLWVATGSQLLAILTAQLEGKKALPAADLINGRSVLPGDRFRSEPGG